MRQRRRKGTDVCSSCGKEPRRPGQRTGRKCHAKYMREYRKNTITVRLPKRVVRRMKL